MSKSARDPHLESILRLAFVAEFRDPDTQHHLRRIGLLAELVGRELGWSPADAVVLRRAAPMHDIGTVAIPDAILLKPGRLTEEEREICSSTRSSAHGCSSTAERQSCSSAR